MTRRILTCWVFAVLAVLFWNGSANAAYYNRQSYPGSGGAGPVGDGSLSISNNTTTVYLGFNKGTGSFTDNLVMFIDCAPGGLVGTGGITNRANALETAISGRKTSQSTANFAPGFQADFAIVVGVNNGSGIYRLVPDATGNNVQFIRNFNLGPPGNPNATQFYWQFDWSDIGLPNAATNFFKFETSLISLNGFRYLQSFEGITGTEGYNTITFTNYDTYGVQPVPENASVALGIFGGIAVSIAVTTRLRRLSSNRT